MSEAELWDYLVEHHATLAKPFDRDFIWITKADFQPIKSHFSKEFNPFHEEESLRSSGYLSHIHILDQGDYIFAHKDMGNLRRFFPLGLLHFFLDVLPYTAFALIKRKSLAMICARPEN
jgi:hypothetical protein